MHFARFQNLHVAPFFYRVFTYILLIKKDICDRQNVPIKLPLDPLWSVVSWMGSGSKHFLANMATCKNNH